MFGRKLPEGMLRDVTDTDDNSGMLNRIVRVKQTRADRADFRSLHMLGHRAEPIAIDHFNVVIQKKKPRALRLFDGKIVERGKIEGTGRTQNAVRRAREKCARFLRTAVVIDDHNLVVRITRLTR